MIAVIVLTMVKHVNVDNVEGWIKHRINTFCGSVGNKAWKNIWTDDWYPDTDSLIKTNELVSSNFSLRKHLFLWINSIAKSTTENSVVSTCKDIVQLMRGAEMHHLVLIDTYLIRKYPELRSLHVLRDVYDQFNKVIEILRREDIEDILFLKLIYHKDQTAEFNRQNFQTFAIVATTCARFEHPSFENYFMDNSDKAQELSEIIYGYLNHRRNLTFFALGESNAVSMGKRETEQYFNKVLKDYLALINQSSMLSGNPGPNMMRGSGSVSPNI